MARQDSYFSSSILERFENALVTVNYSNVPHSQDYLARGNKHATDKIAAELCTHAFYLAMNGACGVWYVQFQVLNNLENAASLNNSLLREGFQSASKWKTRTSHLGD